MFHDGMPVSNKHAMNVRGSFKIKNVNPTPPVK